MTFGHKNSFFFNVLYLLGSRKIYSCLCYVVLKYRQMIQAKKFYLKHLPKLLYSVRLGIAYTRNSHLIIVHANREDRKGG